MTKGETGGGSSDEGTTGPVHAALDFDSQFERLSMLAFRVSHRILGPAGDPEDIAAETMARAQVHWKRIDGYPEAWVVTVAGRLAVRDARRRQRGFPAVPAPGPTPSAEEIADRVALAGALRGLSRLQRQVVVMRYLADLPDQTIAETMGCSVSTVRTHARRGLSNLRRQLSDPPAWLRRDSDREEDGHE